MIPAYFLSKGVGEGIPPLFIIQGANDTIVIVDGSRAFVRLLLEKHLGQRWSRMFSPENMALVSLLE
jgi:hypothetical protein